MGMMLLKSPLLMLVALPLIALVVLVAYVLSMQARIKKQLTSVTDAIQLQAELCDA